MPNLPPTLVQSSQLFVPAYDFQLNLICLSVEVDKFGDYLADLLPNMATKILGGFGKYAERLSAIQNAVTP